MEWQLRKIGLRTSLWKRMCVTDAQNWGRKGLFWPLKRCLLQCWVQQCWTGDMIILFRVQISVIMREWKRIQKAETDREWRSKIYWEMWRLVAKTKTTAVGNSRLASKSMRIPMSKGHTFFITGGSLVSVFITFHAGKQWLASNY